jgi:hypothetical protein
LPELSQNYPEQFLSVRGAIGDGRSYRNSKELSTEVRSLPLIELGAVARSRLVIEAARQAIVHSLLMMLFTHTIILCDLYTVS